jgi:phosphatidylserine/phosphatidylglycerophosphate/cardiolipin synthase-like enzyme
MILPYYSDLNPLSTLTTSRHLQFNYIPTGSSNFGERSWYRDFELGFVLTTQNHRLVRYLQQECNDLESYTTLPSPISYSYSYDEQEGGSSCGKQRSVNGLQKKKVDPWYLPWLTKTLRTFL